MLTLAGVVIVPPAFGTVGTRVGALAMAFPLVKVLSFRACLSYA